MDVRTVRVSGNGQVVIPASVRRRLGLHRGSTLLLIEDEGRIVLAKAERVAEALEEDFSDLTKYAERAFRKLWDDEADDVWSVL